MEYITTSCDIVACTKKPVDNTEELKSKILQSLIYRSVKIKLYKLTNVDKEVNYPEITYVFKASVSLPLKDDFELPFESFSSNKAISTSDIFTNEANKVINTFTDPSMSEDAFSYDDPEIVGIWFEESE